MTEPSLSARAEHLITTRFRKTIWRSFISAIKHYALLRPNDSVAVCVSGGKDSLLLAKCMQLLQKYSDFDFDLKFLSMDPGYTPENRALIEENAALLGISPTYFDTDILSCAENAPSPCHVCAAMRRGHLYKQAKMLGCNKIALGHHYDDVVETVLMSMLYGGEFKTMLPRLQSDNYEGMELIRPLYLVREKQALLWRDALGLNALTCACSVTRKEDGGARRETKRLLEELESRIPGVHNNIFASTKAVQLSSVLGYRLPGENEVLSAMEMPKDFLDIFPSKQ